MTEDQKQSTGPYDLPAFTDQLMKIARCIPPWAWELQKMRSRLPAFPPDEIQRLRAPGSPNWVTAATIALQSLRVAAAELDALIDEVERRGSDLSKLN